jgi:hypothetical protein
VDAKGRAPGWIVLDDEVAAVSFDDRAAAAAGKPGWPGRRMRTETCSGAACAAAAEPSQAPTSSAVNNRPRRYSPDRIARHYSRPPCDDG